MKLLALIAALIPIAASHVVAQTPIEVKVVVVTMFEVGADTGDTPGELQYWVERENFHRIYEFPQGWRNVRMNDDGVLIICTGIGTARAAASIMALGLDQRFDLSKAYWVVAGIAGVDPEDASTGSAAWAEWVVDGDLAHEIDAREIPEGWPTGYVPLRKGRPYEMPRHDSDEGEVYRLDPALVEWAYRLTRDIRLTDSPAMQRQRALYAGRAASSHAPRVLKGDVLSSGTYWHGRKLSEWANEWVKYHTAGQGRYVMTAMEDSGTLQSLAFLHAAGRVNARRVLVLRTASNFDQQHPGSTAAESLNEKARDNPAFLPSLDAAHRVGSAVVKELVRGWSQYREKLPQPK